MDMQEAGLGSDYRCRQCRGCSDCRRGAGHERLSLRQEAEQQLIRESIFIDEVKGIATAKLPFVSPPETHLKNNRNVALKMLDRILNKYCKDPNQKNLFKKHGINSLPRVISYL